MRVWIISDKRWGDSDEEVWTAEVCNDPRPGDDPDFMFDRCVYSEERFDTKAKARRAAKQMESNAVGVAWVYRQRLEQVEGNSYDWITVGEREEVECLLADSPMDTVKP